MLKKLKKQIILDVMAFLEKDENVFFIIYFRIKSSDKYNHVFQIGLLTTNINSVNKSIITF